MDIADPQDITALAQPILEDRFHNQTRILSVNISQDRHRSTMDISYSGDPTLLQPQRFKGISRWMRSQLQAMGIYDPPLERYAQRCVGIARFVYNRMVGNDQAGRDNNLWLTPHELEKKFNAAKQVNPNLAFVTEVSKFVAQGACRNYRNARSSSGSGAARARWPARSGCSFARFANGRCWPAAAPRGSRHADVPALPAQQGRLQPQGAPVLRAVLQL